MAKEETQTVHTEHIMADPETLKHEGEVRRTSIDQQIPVQNAFDNHLDHDPKKVARVRRRVDARVCFMLGLLYFWCFIDRGNLGNANIAGMGTALNLTTNNRYTIVVMIFFVGYPLMDLPSTWLMKKIGATLFIPTVCLGFSVVTLCTGAVQRWYQLAAIRILLGLLEGAFLPASLFMIQVWYTRQEYHKRITGYYLIGIGSSGISGLLAFGIEKMDGDAGVAGWRWIFIIEGIVSIFCALASYVVFVGLPEHSTFKRPLGFPAFLDKEDAAVIIAHIDRDRRDARTEQFGLRDMLSHLKDWQVWEWMAYVFLNNNALYAFSFFLPIILKRGFGYSQGRANLLTFPPYACAVVWMAISSWFGDRYQIRGPLMMFNCFLYVIGLSMTGFATKLSVRYGGVFLGVIGICANVPTQFAYQHSNTVGQARRALSMAMMTMGGAFGGIVSGNIFRQEQAPRYIPAISICLAFQCITLLLITKNYFLFTYLNRKADRGEIVIQGVPGFRYTL